MNDRLRRLTSGVLYKIEDKRGKLVPFVPNRVQKHFLMNQRYKNIILKSRQHGMTTLIDIEGLDYAIFNSHKKVHIIADTDSNAKEIFKKIIKLVWDKLPPDFKVALREKSSNVKELSFEGNDSMISVGTSKRGGTLQFLHISEYAKVCKDNPEKADEIKSGALNTIAPDNYVFIESTAMTDYGDFYDKCILARDLMLKGEPLTKLDYKFFFYPRYLDDTCQLEGNISLPSRLVAYFDNLEKSGQILDIDGNPIKLTKEQKNFYYKKEAEQGLHMYREYPTTREEAFKLALEGAIFEKQTEFVLEHGRLTEGLYNPDLLVHTAWDLGYTDAMAIIFFQIIGDRINIIDYWEGNKYSISAVKSQILDVKAAGSSGYKYGTHLVPHDAAHHQVTDGETRVQYAAKIGLRFRVVPQVALKQDAIDKARHVFPRLRFEEPKVERLWKCLKNYMYKYDEKNRIYTTPVHNWASHGADALLTLAGGIHIIEQGQKILTIEPIRSQR